MFGRFGWAEILVIVILVLILFSHNKIPAMMKNLADGLKVFKKELKTAPAKSEPAAPAAKGAAKSPAKNAAKKAPAKKAAAKTVKKNGNADAGKIIYVEFGAYASMAAAHAAARRLTAAHGDVLAGYEFVVLEQGAKSPFKLRIAFDSVADADAFVKNAHGIKCHVVA